MRTLKKEAERLGKDFIKKAREEARNLFRPSQTLSGSILYADLSTAG